MLVKVSESSTLIPFIERRLCIFFIANPGIIPVEYSTNVCFVVVFFFGRALIKELIRGDDLSEPITGVPITTKSNPSTDGCLCLNCIQFSDFCCFFKSFFLVGSIRVLFTTNPSARNSFSNSCAAFSSLEVLAA